MKRLLIILSALIAILLAAAVIIPFLIPTSVYKSQIESAATTALGREVTLKGDPKLSILPVISARIDGADIANPEGFSDPLMIEAGSLQATVKLLPLLSRRVEVGKITLDDATVRLEQLADGSVNWEFGTPGSDPESGGGFETGIDRAALSNASVFYRSWVTGEQYALTEFDGSAQLKALDQPLSSNGKGRLNGQPFDYRIRLDTLQDLTAGRPVILDAKLGTIFGDIDYDGALTLADTPVLDGSFDIASDTLGQLLTVLGDEDLPIVASALNSVRAKGTVSGPALTAAIDFTTLKLGATGLDLDYKGALTLGASPSLNGTVDMNAADAQRLLKPGHALIPLLALMGDVDLSADVTGPLNAPALTGIKLKQRSADLATDYSGDLSLAGDQAITGALDLRSDNPRKVLETFGTVLPEGESLNAVSIKGQTTGSLMAPNLSGAALVLDDTTATGDIGADLRGPRPRIVADLTMDTLDLTPFLGSGSQKQDQTPSLNEDWDDTPFDLAGLRAVDATVTVAADTVVIDQITLQDALLNTRLDDGRLSAIFRRDDDTPGFRVFQGDWYGDLVLDASRSTPTLELEALATSIAAQEMLTALTGFQNLSGLGDVHVKMSSQGNSLKSLINDLDGNFESDLNHGALKGLNLAKMVRDATSLTDLARSGNLTITSFRDAISPEAETDFSQFIGNLEFTNGVASISDLSIENPVVGITGAGSIDLGARTLDISLTPRVDISASGAGSTLALGDIPIPVRAYGNWSNIQFGIDQAAVQAELTARLRGQAGSEIGDRIGGDAGRIIGDIIGGRSTAPSTPSETPSEPSTEPPADAEQPAEEPDLEDELRDRALDALFGRRDPEPPAEEAPEPETP
ncbi:MAG: AsmA family protein [Hyphomonadaceae bacterium]|nr:AsmA family protein [Hyphomonadaceae bacterium]